MEQVVSGINTIRDRLEVAEKIAIEEDELFVIQKLLELRGQKAGDGADDSGHGVSRIQKSREQAHTGVFIGACQKNVHIAPQTNYNR